jgi:hypothetical protein
MKFMHIIRTFEQLADGPPNTELAAILKNWLDRLQAYEGYHLPELAIICILGSVEELAAMEVETGHQLLEVDGYFRPVEIATQHQNWIEMVFILSDDGFGLVLLVPTDAEPAFLALCEQAMT